LCSEPVEGYSEWQRIVSIDPAALVVAWSVHDTLYELLTRLSERPQQVMVARYGPVAIGCFAAGVLALGGVAVGLAVLAGVALKGIALGGLAIGIGLAVGWAALSLGYAIGGLASEESFPLNRVEKIVEVGWMCLAGEPPHGPLSVLPSVVHGLHVD
jgi:hypothetical protein